MYFIQYVTFSFDGKFTSYDYLKKFRKICGKYREEMWEIKKRNLGEFPSNLCHGLAIASLTVMSLDRSISEQEEMLDRKNLV